MRCVEQTVAGVGGATAGEFGFGKAKCNKMKFCVMCECLIETGSGNTLGLNDTGNYHDANSGMKLANVLHKFNNRFAGIDYRIDQYYRELSLQMMELEIFSIACMDEHGKREGVVDAKSHGFAAAH